MSTTTTAMEKLFAQIFERKRQIIDGAKQQSDSYTQHLASTLLVQGITPPPWLWNPSRSFNTTTSDPKEFKKEELLSELLLPHPRSTVSYRGGFRSLYKQPIVLGSKDTGIEENRVFRETHLSDEGNLGQRPALVLDFNNNEDERLLNSDSEQNVGAVSLQGRNAGRVSNIITQPAHGRVSERLSFKNQASSVDEKVSSLVECRGDDAGCASNSAPEQDVSAVSLQGQTVVSVSDINTEPADGKISESLLFDNHSPDRGSKADDRPAFQPEFRDTEVGCASNSATVQDVSDIILQGRSLQNVLSHDVSVLPQQELSEELYFETRASSSGCIADNSLTSVPECQDNNVECTLTSDPELDQSIISPQMQTEASTSGNFNLREHSLIVQRSKSRQKAFELRKTVEKATKMHHMDMTASGACSSGDNLDGDASRKRQPHNGDELLALARNSGTLSYDHTAAEKTGNCLSKEKDANLYCGRMTRSRSSCNQLTNDAKPKLENSFDAADGGTTLKSQSNSFEGIANRLHLSNADSQRVTRSKSGALGKSLLNYLNSQDECRRQNAPNFEFSFHCLDTNAIVNQTRKAEHPVGSEVIVHGSVKVDAAHSEHNLDVAGPSVGFEGFDTVTTLNSRMSVKPKILDFDEMRNTSHTEIIRPTKEKGSQDNLPEEIYKSMESPASLVLHQSLEEQSLANETSIQISEPRSASYKICFKECVVDDEHVSRARMSKNAKDDSEAAGIQSSPFPHGEKTKSLNADEDIDRVMYKVEGFNSLPNQQVQEGKLGYNRMLRGEGAFSSSSNDNSKVCQASSTRHLEATGQSTFTLDATQCRVEENQGVMWLQSGVDSVLLQKELSVRGGSCLSCDEVDAICCDGKNFTSDEILEESSARGRKLGYATENSWPLLKRRKIESQETSFISAAPNFMVKERHNSGGSTNGRNLISVAPNLESTLVLRSSPLSHEGTTQSYANKSPDAEMLPKFLNQEIESLQEMPIEQNKLDIGDNYQSKRYILSPHDVELESVAVSSFSDEVTEDSQSSINRNARKGDTTSIVLGVSMQGVEKSYDLGPSTSDQTMPEFEGFIIGEEDSGQRHIVGPFECLDLPTTIVERASFLEQLCRSAGSHTPLSQLSTSFKFHNTPDADQSVPSGVLEHLNPKSTSNLDVDDVAQLRSSYSCLDELKGSSHVLHFNSIPFSDTLYGRNSKATPTSPVSKIWDRISWKSNSSEKKLSSNPGLTCFPIEEDPSISEEEEDKDEVMDSAQEGICSSLRNHGDKRSPLADITQANVDLPSVSAAEKFQDRSSLNSVNTDVKCTGTRVKQRLGKHHSNKRRCTNDAKKNLNLSAIGIATGSLSSRFSKPILPRKTSLRKGGQTVSEKDSRHNNIISNISSFVSLVQQKQAAAVVTGKRDVKVKALEAAEAAKRLEEKRQNDRKLKKEALKLERARMEQENLRQAEVKKKKLEDEQKKKEADAVARKRLREEKEKEEKERKRRRIEEKRQQQREQEEKLRARKAEKEIFSNITEEKLNNGTRTADAVRKPQKLDIDRGHGNKLKKSDTESMASVNLEKDVRDVVLDGSESYSQCRVSVEVTDTSRERSYEISPYQSTDDEDDDEEEISPKKFGPSWASKKSRALLVFSQQEVDPNVIFPPQSFCPIDEAVRP